jgi:hypothetical protein
VCCRRAVAARKCFQTVEQREDVWVLELGGGLDLGEEPLGAQRSAQVGVQHLDGDVAVVLQVVREIHGGHAARAELALDAIAVGEAFAQSRDVAAHLPRGRCNSPPTPHRFARFSRSMRLRASTTRGCKSGSAFAQRSMNRP